VEDAVEVVGMVHIAKRFGDLVAIREASLSVRAGEIHALVGENGAGKTTLMNILYGLLQRDAGEIALRGQPVSLASPAEAIRAGIGMVHQHFKLAPSFSVAENIIVPIREHAEIEEEIMRSVAALKIAMVGLPPDTGNKKPSELSGGMRKRASLARALALDPDILFLDEPTAGLDPIGAAHYDELVKGLRDSLGLTVIMVTHDLDSLYAACDRIAVLLDKRVVAGTMDEMLAYDHPWVREYFHGPRGRAAAHEPALLDKATPAKAAVSGE